MSVLLIAVFFFVYFLSVEDYQQDKQWRSLNVHSLRLADDYFALFKNENVENKYFARDNLPVFLLQDPERVNYQEDPELAAYLQRARVVSFDFGLFDSPERCRGVLLEDLLRPRGEAEVVYFVMPVRPCEFVPMPTYFHVESLEDEHFSVTYPIHRYSFRLFFKCLIGRSDGCYPFQDQDKFWSKFGDENTRFASNWRANAVDQIKIQDTLIFAFFRGDTGAPSTPSRFDRFGFRGSLLDDNVRLSSERLDDKTPDEGATLFGVKIAARFLPIAVSILLYYNVTLCYQDIRNTAPGDKSMTKIPLAAGNWSAALLSFALAICLPLSVLICGLVTVGLIKMSFFGILVSPLTGEFFSVRTSVSDLEPLVRTGWFEANLMLILYGLSMVLSLMTAMKLFRFLVADARRNP